MKYGDTPRSRRRVLALAACAGTGSLAGCTTSLTNLLSASPAAEASMTVGPDDDGTTDDERARYVDRMAERYGATAAERINPGAESVGLGPGVTLGTRLWDDEQSLVVTDSSGDTIAESDNYAALYENVYPSTTGADRYVYWLWAGARPRDGCELRELWSHVDLAGGGDVLKYDPGGDRQDNGTISSHPERTGMDADEFAVRWRGEHAGTQVVTGGLSERRDEGAERAFEWTVHLAGEKR